MRAEETIRVERLDDPALDVFREMHENRLAHLFEPEPGLFLAETVQVILRALDAGYEPWSCLIEDTLTEGAAAGVLARLPSVPVYTAPKAVLTQLTGYALTRGVLCAMRRKELPSAEEVLAGTSRIAVLEDVENPTNLGAIFRSAAALGMDAVLLAPGCCDPLYRRAVRVSMGTVFQVPWTVLRGADWTERLHAMGFSLAAMALREDTISVRDAALRAERRLAVILGAEGTGLPDRTILSCDHAVMIPMAHGVDSLNVAAAAAVAFWELGNR